MRATNAVLAQIERCSREAADLSVSAFQTLAIIDGADAPLTARDVAAQLLVTSASMASLLDTLERRGLVERHRDPDDRRLQRIHLTDDARRIVDQVLPTIRAAIAEIMRELPDRTRATVIAATTLIHERASSLAGQPLPVPKGRRRRRPSAVSG